MITAKSMIGRPTYYAPNYVNVWFAHDSCSHFKFKEVKIPKVVQNDHNENGVFEKNVNTMKKSSLAVDSKSNKSVTHSESKTYYRGSSVPVETSRNADSIEVDLDCYLGPKYKSRKQSTPKSLSQRKRAKKHEKWTLTDNSSIPLTQNPDDKQFRSKSVEDALEVIENRKKTIKAKLLVRKEHLLTQEEEQDIHTRADLYAITTIPDTKYCILSSEDSIPHSIVRYEEFQEEDILTPARKKRRRNYGNTNCYVTHHNNDDIFDNTKMLPIGTRLLKPPTKLVELVAQAISGSPDGLLQVQQIYTFLQNKYPFFRYMDRVAINSWRSSIRHALYQKWFRKIRFDSSFISSKGCYWAINNKSNPKEWSLPEGGFDIDAVEKHLCLDTLHYIDDEEETKEVAAIAKQLLSADECPGDDSLDSDQQQTLSPDEQQHIPSPVKEPDPILSTCTTDWNNEDICISSNESGHGTMTPVNSPSFPAVLYLTQENQDCDIKTDLILGTPLNSPPVSSTDYMSIADLLSSKSKTVQLPGQKLGRTEISPMVHWTPDWEEYGSYIISPQNMATQKYVQSLPGEKDTDSNNNITVNEDITEMNAKPHEIDTSCSFLQTDSLESSPLLNCTCDSDTESCEFEIVAEFPKSDFTTDLELEICS